jgi:hypothetical protein
MIFVEKLFVFNLINNYHAKSVTSFSISGIGTELEETVSRIGPIVGFDCK